MLFIHHKQCTGFKIAILPLAVMMLLSCASNKKNTTITTGSSAVTPGSVLQKKYANLLGVQPGKITNSALYSYIDKWLNTAYSYGSQSEKGIDCSGFTQILFDAVYKKKLPRTSEAQYASINAFTNLRNLTEGDLVFFTTIKGKKISHVGIYLQNNHFVNATSKGVAISDMSIAYWKERFVGAGRVQ